MANRAVIRERQKKEIARLTTTLAKLQKNSQFTTEQVGTRALASPRLASPRLTSPHSDPGVREVPGRRAEEAIRGQETEPDPQAPEVRLQEALRDGRHHRLRDPAGEPQGLYGNAIPSSRCGPCLTLSTEAKFEWSATEHGVFEIKAKIDKMNVETMTIKLDDLLEKHHAHVEKIEVGAMFRQLLSC